MLEIGIMVPPRRHSLTSPSVGRALWRRAPAGEVRRLPQCDPSRSGVASQPALGDMFVRRDKSIRLLLALAMGITSVGGCSGLPRIDPSGQRLLIFPGEEPPIPSLPVA